MSNKKELELNELVKIFEKLGIQDPISCANSQINEGIEQLGCLVFLKQVWKYVADIHNKWINELCHPQAMEVAQKCLSTVSKDELTMLVRVMQIDLLGMNLQILDNGGPMSDDIDINWQLFTVDEEGNPLRPIIGLVENYEELEE